MTGQINVNKIAARTGTAITVESGHVITQPGSVIQTVATGTIADTTISSASWTDTNDTLSITPQFSNSKILFIYTNHVRVNGDGDKIIGLLCKYYVKPQKKTNQHDVIITVMSNMGLEKYLTNKLNLKINHQYKCYLVV